MSKITAKKLYNTKNMSRLEWLAVRKKGLGGSEAASLSGLNNYSSALKVYMDKTDTEVNEDSISEPAEWGIRQEPIIFQKFKEEHPEWRIQRSYFMWCHSEYDFLFANVDGLIFDPKRGWGVLEIKTTNEFLGKEWGDIEAPEHYVIQIQHYLYVLGLDWGIFSVLIGGNRYKEFYIERNNELIDSLVEIEKDFWFNHVLKNNPPLGDGSDSAEEMIQLMYPMSTALPEEEVLELDSSVLDLINELDEVKEKRKELEKREKEIGQIIESKIGNYQQAVCGERKLSFKPKRSFNEDVLKKEDPELYEEYSKNILDKTKLKRDLPNVYEKYMIQNDKRNLTIK